MRIWDVDPNILCHKHLVAEHRELHAVWTILTKNKKGYRHHPETKRWVGRLKALYRRHERLLREMKRRGYQHHTPLDKRLATGSARQPVFVDSIQRQRKLLCDKPCPCPLDCGT